VIQKYTIYNISTGKPVRWGTNDLSLVEVPRGYAILEGDHPPSDGLWLDTQTGEWTKPPDEQVNPRDMRAKMSLTPRQMIIGLYFTRMATPEECIAAATTGTMPASVAAAISALPEQDQVIAKITWGRMTQVDRTNPLVSLLAAAVGMTDEQVDAFFATYSGV
jgi:hypothetical protein